MLRQFFSAHLGRDPGRCADPEAFLAPAGAPEQLHARAGHAEFTRQKADQMVVGLAVDRRCSDADPEASRLHDADLVAASARLDTYREDQGVTVPAATGRGAHRVRWRPRRAAGRHWNSRHTANAVSSQRSAAPLCTFFGGVGGISDRIVSSYDLRLFPVLVSPGLAGPPRPGTDFGTQAESRIGSGAERP